MLKPPAEVQARIYLRLLARDVSASSELMGAYLVPLLEEVKRRLRHVPEPALLEDVVDEAVMETLLRFPHEPEKCRGPEKLWTYLVMDALGDARNALDSQRRKLSGLKLVTLDVAESIPARNESIEDEIVNRERPPYVPEGVDIIALRREIESIQEDPLDRQILDLLTEGVRAYGPYAAVLGVTHLPEKEQQEEVNRAKGRIRARLRRLGDRLR